MSDLFYKYMKERLNIETISSEKGFICLQEHRDGLIISDFYVDKQFRNGGEARSLFRKAYQHCQDVDAKALYGKVWPGVPGSDRVLVIALREGFKIAQAKDGFIEFYMEVKHG